MNIVPSYIYPQCESCSAQLMYSIIQYSANSFQILPRIYILTVKAYHVHPGMVMHEECMCALIVGVAVLYVLCTSLSTVRTGDIRFCNGTVCTVSEVQQSDSKPPTTTRAFQDKQCSMNRVAASISACFGGCDARLTCMTDASCSSCAS